MVSHWKWLVALNLSFLSLSLMPIKLEAKTESLQEKVIFKKSKIKINNQVISVELAESAQQQEHGLMFRTKLPKNSGMLFVFEEERILSFWMKNTLIDLSIAYINKDKKIIDIQEMKATSSLDMNIPSYPSRLPALYALEMNANWFSQKKIKVGDSFSFVSPSGR